ncbi:MAG: GNAT family N-acetyltransferase [Planctomycetota bacterium]
MVTTACPKNVVLKNGRRVLIRPLTRDDLEQLQAFFLKLPEQDRLFLRSDVRDAKRVHRWAEEMDSGHLLALVAMDHDQIVATGRLYYMNHEWMRHVGEIRLITAKTHRHLGLGVLLVRELVDLAGGHGLEKIQAQVVEDSVGAIKMFQAIGFKTEAILKGMVKDQSGKKRNLVIMVNDVQELDRILEDWIQDSMQAAHRVPGPCEG